MSEQEEQEASRKFLGTLLKQSCFLRCEEGADRRDEAKEACVQGCLLAAGKPVNQAAKAMLIVRLDDEMEHSRVLGQERSGDILRKQHGLGEQVAKACWRECKPYCEGKGFECQKFCEKGCSNFVDSFLR